MSKAKLTKCFVCHCGEDCGDKTKLSRKKKKLLHKAHAIFSRIRSDAARWTYPESCDQIGSYKALAPFIARLNYYRRYMSAIHAICHWADDQGEEVQLLCSGPIWRLGWYWEHDNGLYTESGIMPFQFGGETGDGTWCWDETRRLCECFGLDILQVKDERHLLNLVSKELKNERFVRCAD